MLSLGGNNLQEKIGVIGNIYCKFVILNDMKTLNSKLINEIVINVIDVDKNLILLA